MKPLYTLLIAVAIMLFTSCEKDYSYEGGFQPSIPTTPDTTVTPVIPPVVDTPPPPISDEDKLKALLLSGDFQPRAFYSDIPVDYITTDSEVKQETDLWAYVAPWLVDDVDHFTETTVTVTQHSVKRPLLTDPTVTRNYLIATDADGVYIVFLDYLYDPLTYRVHEIGADYFILAVPGPQGSTLFSRFERVVSN